MIWVNADALLPSIVGNIQIEYRDINPLTGFKYTIYECSSTELVSWCIQCKTSNLYWRPVWFG